MDQGLLDVRHTADGRSVVQPKIASANYFDGVDAALGKRGKTMPLSMRAAIADPSRAIELADMKSVVRELAASRSAQ
jgi:hypothetical protein